MPCIENIRPWTGEYFSKEDTAFLLSLHLASRKKFTQKWSKDFYSPPFSSSQRKNVCDFYFVFWLYWLQDNCKCKCMTLFLSWTAWIQAKWDSLPVLIPDYWSDKNKRKDFLDLINFKHLLCKQNTIITVCDGGGGGGRGRYKNK